MSTSYRFYRKTGLFPARPYVPGEDMSNISVSKTDTLEIGGMVMCNPDKPEDKWYIGKEHFSKNYEVVD